MIKIKNKKLLIPLLFLLFFPLITLAEATAFPILGESCSVGDICANGACEQSSLSGPQNTFCTCTSDSDCTSRFGKKTPQETWTCKPGEAKTKNLHYCVSSTRGTQDPMVKSVFTPPPETPNSDGDEKTEKLTAPVISIPIPSLPSFADIEVSPGETVNVPYIAQYVVAIYKYGLTLASILAVMMIVIGGIMYIISSADPSKVALAKQMIFGSITGITVLLCSFIMLKIINPNLVTFTAISVETVKKDIQHLGAAAYSDITGKPLLPASEYEKMAIEAGREVGFTDDCIMVSLLRKESGSLPDAIGHDENVHWDIPSRRDFLKSGVKWSKATFPAINKIDTKSSEQKSVKNDDPTKEIATLDWRFSHGLGLTQVTIFPTDKCNGGIGKKNPFNGICYSPDQLLDPKISLDYGAAYLKSCYTKAGSKGLTGEDQVLGAFLGYNAGPGNIKKELLATHHYPIGAKKLLDACHASNP
ncbi:MAG: hypothetical protein UT02_C0029G0007 [Parcubacteria group bacterium GW2011_GWC2_38_7]|nr:MAG: hypothetical protein UT02_C0029G0007 [Parcubacteria group bacterium GW2011_GWC2_38_7]